MSPTNIFGGDKYKYFVTPKFKSLIGGSNIDKKEMLKILSLEEESKLKLKVVDVLKKEKEKRPTSFFLKEKTDKF